MLLVIDLILLVLIFAYIVSGSSEKSTNNQIETHQVDDDIYYPAPTSLDSKEGK